MSIIQYRPEIDGLRTLAVVSVILFHMDASWLTGGFMGVDIFFVISGYLISTIILIQLNNNNFSLLNFYTRRIKRILPVFYLVLIITIITGYLILQPKDIIYLNNSAKKIVIFLGNNFFTDSGDYFSLSANEMPLLHTWSLAVEEQFYFLWPVISIILFKIRKKIIFPLILMFFSFLISEYLLLKPQYKSFAYYSLLTRSGELLIGYLTAALTYENYKIRMSSRYVIYTGIVLVLLPLFLINKTSKFPGMNALYVCIGTAILIYNLNNKDYKDLWVYKFLRSNYIVLLGKRSYSLYLWHWPILAYMRYIYGSYSLPHTWIILAAVLTITLSLISYLFVENKTRYLKLNFYYSFLLFYILPTASVFLLITLLNKTNLATEELYSKLYTTYGEVCHGKISNHCIRGNKDVPTEILIVGDSHAAHYNYFFEELGKKYNWSAKIISSSSCSPVIDYNELILPGWAQNGCKELKKYFWDHYKEYKIIIFSSRWDYQLGLTNDQADSDFSQKLEATFDQLSKNVKHIYVLSQVPLLSNNPFRIKKFLNLGLPISIHNEDRVNTSNYKVKELTKKYPNITWIDVVPIFKNFDNGIFFKGNSVYMDNNHLNEYGARILASFFPEDIIKEHLKKNSTTTG